MLSRSLKTVSRMPIRAFSSFTRFDFEDPLKFYDMLTEEEQMIADTAKAYAYEKLLPRVTDAYQKEYFDREIMNEMGEMGFLGCTIKDDYDLPGVSSVAYGKSNTFTIFNRSYQ